MFARMKHGIPEYNALTDKHCKSHNFLYLAPVKQLADAGLLKKNKEGAWEVKEAPSRYLFYGEQPDGAESTRPATGHRSVKYKKFKQERKPKLEKVEADRKAAISRSRLQPLDQTHGVNSALRVVLSSPDLMKKRERERQMRRERAASPSLSHTRPSHGGPESRSPTASRRRRPRGSSGTKRSGRKSRTGGRGGKGGDAGSVHEWTPEDVGEPLHATSRERSAITNAEYAATHEVPPESLKEFLAQKRLKEEQEEAKAAELNARSRNQTGYYAQFGGDGATVSDEQARVAAAHLERHLAPGAPRDGIASFSSELESRWASLADSTRAASQAIEDHFAALRAALVDREAVMKQQLASWKAGAQAHYDSCRDVVEAAKREVASASTACSDALAQQGKDEPRAFIKRAAAAAGEMNAALVKARDAMDPRVTSAPGGATVEAFFELKEARELENRVAGHGQIIILPSVGAAGSAGGSEVRALA